MLRFAIERGVILSVFLAILLLFGLVAMFRIPVQMTPDIELRVISVITSWPGATPLEIESEILMEQEVYLRSLDGLVRMTGSTTDTTGAATIELEFSSDTDLQDALLRVNSALSQVAEYPENVDPPRLVTSSNRQNPFIFIGVEPDQPDRYSRAELSTVLEKHVTSQLERIPGVSQVTIFGESAQQVHVTVDPERLASKGITIAELRVAIRSRNQDISGGDIDSGKRRFQIRTKGRYESLEDIEDTIVAERDGVVVRVKDVGEVILSNEEQRVYSYLDGEPAVMMGVRKAAGANVVQILDDVLAEIDNLNQGVLAPYGLQLRRYADDVKYVKNAIRVVRKNLLLGGVLACLVLYLFLHALTPTLIGAVGVPICTIGAFLGLLLMDRTLNVISLAGVAFAIGMTLDNSIVVLENIFRHRAMGKKPFAAAFEGVGEVWPAVLASTFTTVLVFVPIVLIEEEVGQLYSDIAIAMSAAILMSMLIAVTAIPSIVSRLPESVSPEAYRDVAFLAPFRRLAGRFQERLLVVLEGIIRSTPKRLAVVLGVLSLSCLIIVFLTPKAEYLPEGEESKIFTLGFPPTGYNVDEVRKIGKRFDDLLGPQVGADGTDFVAGETSIPPLMFRSYYASYSIMFGISESIDPRHTDQLIAGISQGLSDIPGVLIFSSRGSIFPGSFNSRTIQLDISGADLRAVYEVTTQTFLKIQQVFEDASIRPYPGLNMSQPILEVQPDWRRAAEVGMSAEDLGYTVWAMADGAYLDDYFLDDDKIDIYLRSSAGRVENPDDIGQLSIYTPAGEVLPLSALADITQSVSANSIRRVDASRTVTLEVVPPADIPLESAADLVREQVIQPLIAAGEVPPGIQVRIGGASDKLLQAREALFGNVMLSIALAYLLMVAIFSHWGYPLMIMLSIPLGISGGIVGLWLMNLLGMSTSLDVLTMLGMVVLIGTVVNNPILLVEQTRRLISEGEEIGQAVLESVKIRLRPIMMSMITTISGLSPVVFLPGAGTEIYRGLGAIVLFGLFFSTILTLTFVPSLLSLILECVHKKRLVEQEAA